SGISQSFPIVVVRVCPGRPIQCLTQTSIDLTIDGNIVAGPSGNPAVGMAYVDRPKLRRPIPVSCAGSPFGNFKVLCTPYELVPRYSRLHRSNSPGIFDSGIPAFRYYCGIPSHNGFNGPNGIGALPHRNNGPFESPFVQSTRLHR